MKFDSRVELLKDQVGIARDELDKMTNRLENLKDDLGSDYKKKKKELLKSIKEGRKELDVYYKKVNKLVHKQKKKVEEDEDAHKVKRFIKSPLFKRLAMVAVALIAKREKIKELAEKAIEKLESDSERDSLMADIKDKVSLLIRMIQAYAKGEYKKVPWGTLMKVVIGVLYFILMLDIIPDFIPILGLTDDVAILAWVFNSISEDLEHFKNWEEEQFITDHTEIGV